MKLADNEIIPAVLAKIEHCAARAEHFRAHLAHFPRAGKLVKDAGNRYAKAADRLRDFATVELLCEELGITRAEALSEPEDYCCGGCGAALEETYGFPWHMPDEDCRKIRNSEALS